MTSHSRVAAAMAVPSILKTTLKTLLPLGGRGLILAGHGVTTGWANRKTEMLHIPFEDFRSIILLLEELDFEFLTTEQVVELAARGFPHRRHWVHISFDDGYQNIFDVAYPFLKERGVPFSLYVSTHYVETGERFPTFWLRLAEELSLPLRTMFPELNLAEDSAYELFERGVRFTSFAEQERILQAVKAAIFHEHGPKILERYYNDAPISLQDLKTLASDPLVHVGSHSHHHIIFHPRLDQDIARRNIERSISLLRDWGVAEQPTFCFPNGDCAPQWTALLRDFGIKAAYPDTKGFVETKADPMLLPRFWMTTAKRLLGLAAMSLLGNKTLYAFGRRPPPQLANAQ